MFGLGFNIKVKYMSTGTRQPVKYYYKDPEGNNQIIIVNYDSVIAETLGGDYRVFHSTLDEIKYWVGKNIINGIFWGGKKLYRDVYYAELLEPERIEVFEEVEELRFLPKYKKYINEPLIIELEAD